VERDRVEPAFLVGLEGTAAQFKRPSPRTTSSPKQE